jgi:SAM-dependent methyltransferase
LKRLETLIKHRKPEQFKLVDIGSGSGEFLYMALKAGFDASGIEPHAGYCEYTKQSLGLNVVNTTLEKAGFIEESFDIINLNHVLEHMPAPLDTLCALRSLLKKDGIIMIDVPDISLCSHAPWTQFHFAHIYNFNSMTLKALVEKAGFEILNPETETTNIIARKTAASKVDISMPMPANYQYLWQKLQSHTGIGHYKRKKPYARFLRKCHEYPKEFLIVMFYGSAKKILDKIYKTAPVII